MKRTSWLVTSMVAATMVMYLQSPTNAAPAEGEHAVMGLDKGVAVLRPTKGNKVRGAILFEQKEGVIHVTGRVNGLTPGMHGFHIHEFGDLRAPDGTAAGGHYNPHGKDHAGPDSDSRHVGDLGNIEANAEGIAKVDKKITGAKLHFIFGRSVVIHAGEDDLKSQPSGAAGPRVAVGVIGIAK